ncbi:hypothetical protein HWQ46_03035 [Shewanella sp. D64]|uniref:HI1506-related protein n=1 Tax=unclassified Shewanella TaxID=196818 RepID=UPI0022BA5616|nr:MULTISPECIES: HI1506-related protein [unclassified Shewanella]MEC4724521.1 hypothetical protein [Shewanella sp. D64]MEC4736702.1 hypothetical protein [Shewanella sp. E94]WBJ94629.1 hypothetical protein HWQ47_22675 [Shewanella sp. MTB7]
MTKSMSTGADKQRLAVITCFAHHGYRRAGVSFCKGENTFNVDDFSESQLALLHDDPRLKLQFVEADALQAKGSDVKANEQGLMVLSFAEAVLTLEHDNKDHFTGDGKPQCDVLSRLMSQPISASERDRLWAEHLQSNGSSTQAASQDTE